MTYHMVLGRKKSSDAQLSSGHRMRRWLVGKPSLAVDAPIVEGEPTSAVNPDKINPFLMVTRLLASFLVLAIILLSVSWLAFGMTVKPTLWLNGTGWFVKIGAWVEGQAPPGSIAFALNTPVDRSALAKFNRLTDPSSDGKGIVTIVANPQSVLSSSKQGTLVVDGADTGIPAKKNLTVYGTDNYLAVCQAGACTKGDLLIIPGDHVVGQVTGGIGVEGLVKVDNSMFTEPPQN